MMNLIKAKRIENKYSLYTLATLTNIRLDVLEEIEQGIKRPNIYQITNICLALDTDRNKLKL